MCEVCNAIDDMLPKIEAVVEEGTKDISHYGFRPDTKVIYAVLVLLADLCIRNGVSQDIIYEIWPAVCDKRRQTLTIKVVETN